MTLFLRCWVTSVDVSLNFIAIVSHDVVQNTVQSCYKVSHIHYKVCLILVESIYSGTHWSFYHTIFNDPLDKANNKRVRSYSPRHGELKYVSFNFSRTDLFKVQVFPNDCIELDWTPTFFSSLLKWPRIVTPDWHTWRSLSRVLFIVGFGER